MVKSKELFFWNRLVEKKYYTKDIKMKNLLDKDFLEKNQHWRAGKYTYSYRDGRPGDDPFRARNRRL